MTEENLEKKTKRVFAYGALVGLMGGLVVGLPIAFHARNVGHNEGYEEGRKAGVVEGKMEGFVEGREAQLKSRNAFIEIYEHSKGSEPLIFFSRMQSYGSREDYVHRMFCSSEGELITGEKIEITSPDGLHRIMYIDEGMDLTLSPNGQVRHSEAYGDRGDGHIDTIIYYDTIGDCSFCRMSGFSRRQHYENHKEEFDAADAKLNDLRGYFAPAKQDYPFFIY